MSFGLGFSHQEINKRCTTVVEMRDGHDGHVVNVDRPRQKGILKGKFKKIGMNVMKRFDEENAEIKETRDLYGTTIIGGEIYDKFEAN